MNPATSHLRKVRLSIGTCRTSHSWLISSKQDLTSQSRIHPGDAVFRQQLKAAADGSTPGGGCRRPSCKPCRCKSESADQLPIGVSVPHTLTRCEAIKRPLLCHRRCRTSSDFIAAASSREGECVCLLRAHARPPRTLPQEPCLKNPASRTLPQEPCLKNPVSAAPRTRAARTLRTGRRDHADNRPSGAL